MVVELKVGSKGELFLNKQIRKMMNLNPGDRIIVEMLNDSMIIRKIDDLIELFKEKPLSNLQKPDEIEKEIKKIQDEQIVHTIKE